MRRSTAPWGPARIASTAYASLLFLVGPVSASEFQVNTYTTNSQRDPAVAMAPGGDFVVVWTSYGSSGSDVASHSVQGQRFDASGAPDGPEFQVNSYTTGSQVLPVVATDADGDFVVVWSSFGSYGTDWMASSVQGQRFAADGTPLGGQFQVNSYTTGYQFALSVAAADSGDFIVVWRSFIPGACCSIQGQRFAASGAPLGDEFQVNTIAGYAPNAALDADADGNFIVAWGSDVSAGSDTSSSSVQAQRYVANGLSLGPQFQVNSVTTSFQDFPSAAWAAGGDFIIAWDSATSAGTDSSSSSVQLRRFASDSTPYGSEFQINTYTTSSQFYGSVAARPTGDFVVSWSSYGSFGTDQDSSSVHARRFNADGSPLRSEFQVNSYVTSRQRTRFGQPIATAPDGRFVVVWSSLGSNDTDSSSWSVQGRLFDVPIFSDGFEDGTTNQWSNVITP